MLGRTALRWIFPVVHCWESVNIWGIPKQTGRIHRPPSVIESVNIRAILGYTRKGPM